jgi:hypothetical protein
MLIRKPSTRRRNKKLRATKPILKLALLVLVTWAAGKPLVGEKNRNAAAYPDATAAKVIHDAQESRRTAPPGMVLIRSAEFTMGTDDVSSLPTNAQLTG